MAISFSECVDGLQYSFANMPLPFDEAQQFCYGRGGSLAIPSSIYRHNRLLDNLFVNNLNATLIGLRSFSSSPQTPSTFKGIEGQVNGFTAVGEFGSFPWQEEITKKCLLLSGDTGLLEGFSCSTPANFVCEHFCSSPPDFLFDECVDGSQLFLNLEEKSYDEALVDCQRTDPSATLAIPDSGGKLDIILEFLSQASLDDSFVFLGLADYTQSLALSSFERFFSADGSASSFIQSSLPWSSSQPGDPKGNKHCGGVYGANSLLVPESCSIPKRSLCQRSCSADQMPLGRVSERILFEASFVGEVEGDCIDDIKYVLLPETGTFSLGNIRCKTFDSGAQIAQPKTLEGYQNLLDFFDFSNLTGSTVFVGYVDLLFEGGVGNTARFLTSDGERVPFLAGAPGVFPWQSGQPNDSIGIEDCVRLDAQGLADTNCFSLIRPICEVFCGEPGPPPPPYEECVNNIQYFVTTSTTNFQSTLTQCRLFDERAKLAEPKSLEEFERLQQFYIENRVLIRNAFLGFSQGRQFYLADPIIDASDFTTSDGESIPFISVSRSEFPWAFAQPSGNTEFDDICVSMGVDGLLRDDRCDSSHIALCQSPCGPQPTIAPTPAPTVAEGNCTDGVVHVFNPEPLTFFQALVECENVFGLRADLAVPRNEESFLSIQNLLFSQVEDPEGLAWIGLLDANVTSLFAAKEKFKTFDGESIDFTTQSGSFPWEVNEPDNKDFDEGCAVMSKESGLIKDINCFVKLPYMCERPCVARVPEDNEALVIVIFSTSGLLSCCLCIATIALCIKCCSCCCKGSSQRTSSEPSSDEAAASDEEKGGAPVAAVLDSN